MSQSVIFGIANERSLAWSTLLASQELYDVCHVGVLDSKTESKVHHSLSSYPWASKVHVRQCNVKEEGSLVAFFQAIPDRSLTGLVHSIAFADRATLTQPFSYVTREQFQECLLVSVYSLIEMMHTGREKFSPGASVVCLSYVGGEKIIPFYNVMGVAKAALESTVRYLSAEFGEYGIRVNTVSAGPVRTLASSAIKNFKSMLHHTEHTAPLRRTIQADEVAATIKFLLSPSSSGITGTTIYVDGGAHQTLGLPLKLGEE